MSSIVWERGSRTSARSQCSAFWLAGLASAKSLCERGWRQDLQTCTDILGMCVLCVLARILPCCDNHLRIENIPLWEVGATGRWSTTWITEWDGEEGGKESKRSYLLSYLIFKGTCFCMCVVTFCINSVIKSGKKKKQWGIALTQWMLRESVCSPGTLVLYKHSISSM